MSRKIPKIIHYCWFGDKEFPSLVIRCIESWKKYFPDYEFMFWNENNFDIDELVYARQAYDCRKYAFVSDVCRIYVLKKYGGVYLDTDVEILKPLNNQMLYHNAFSGFEDNKLIPTGIMASEKEGRWVNDMYNYYIGRNFIKSDGLMDLTTNVVIITDLMKGKMEFNNTYQEIDNYITFYKSEVFCPKSHKTGKINITKNTYCIHHFAGSWQPKSLKMKSKIVGFLMSIFGVETYGKIKKYIGL